MKPKKGKIDDSIKVFYLISNFIPLFSIFAISLMVIVIVVALGINNQKKLIEINTETVKAMYLSKYNTIQWKKALSEDITKLIEPSNKTDDYNYKVEEHAYSDNINTSNKLTTVEEIVGRYQFNMTAGNAISTRTKEYVHVPQMEQYEKNHTDTMLANSSGGYLSDEHNRNGSIYKAYLVVESTSDGSYNLENNSYDNSLGLNRYTITIVGNRSTLTNTVDNYCYTERNNRRMGYIDITDFVRENGYGWYYVCNVPYDSTNQPNNDRGAGWKIIVIEENPNIPIRALTLALGCSNIGGKQELGLQLDLSGVKTKESGTVTGQLLYSFIGADPNGKTQNNSLKYGYSTSNDVSEESLQPIITKNSIRTELNPLVFIYSRNGNPLSINGWVKGNLNKPYYFVPKEVKYTNVMPTSGEFYVQDASDIELLDIDGNSTYHNVTLGNSSKAIKLSFETKTNVALMGDVLGIVADIDVPTFNSSDLGETGNSSKTTQITTLNSETEVTTSAIISGRITNSSTVADVGLANSEFIISIDKGLRINNYNAKIYSSSSDNIGTAITGTINTENNTITFTDINLNAEGANIVYTVNCAKNSNAKTVLQNEARLSGYLYNSGIVTNNYITGAAYTTSTAIPIYKLTINPNGGILNGSNSISTINIRSSDTEVINIPTRAGYTFKGWSISGEDSKIEEDTFTMGGENAVLTANWQVNVYKITYNLNQGTVIGNPENYTIETNTITLNNPTRIGYIFDGWIEDGQEQAQKTVIIEKGSTGNRNYIAKWTPSPDTPYVVKHWQESLNTQTDNITPSYTLVDTENLTGTTETTVTPDTKTYSGFITPDTETRKILADGTLEINYYYERRKDLSYTVKYLEKGTNKEIKDDKQIENQIFGKEITASNEVVNDIYGYNYDSVSTNTLKITEGENILNIYYIKKDSKVIVHHFIYDIENKIQTKVKLIPDVEIKGKVEDIYETSKSSEITENYNCINEEPENYTGKMGEDTVEVSYYYELKETKIKDNIDTKVITEAQEVKGEIQYETKVEDYIGKVTIEMIAVMPNEIDSEKSDLKEGKYNSETNTITWMEERNVNTFENGTYTEKIQKEIQIIYKEDFTNTDSGIKIEGKTLTYYPDGYLEKEGEISENVKYAERKNGKVSVKYLDIDTNEKIVNGYEITKRIEEDYKTEKKEIPYYKYEKDSKNTEGKITEEDIEVTYHYKKQDFNFRIENTISSITLNGEKIKISNNKLAKIEIPSKEIEKTELIVAYNIKVTNNGEIAGTAKISQTIPDGYEIVEADSAFAEVSNRNNVGAGLVSSRIKNRCILRTRRN